MRISITVIPELECAPSNAFSVSCDHSILWGNQDSSEKKGLGNNFPAYAA